MENITEVEVRNLAEDGIRQLAGDKRFLAFVDYLEFIYEDLKEIYEFQTEREELAMCGRKVMMRTLLGYIKDTTQTDNNFNKDTSTLW